MASIVEKHGVSGADKEGRPMQITKGHTYDGFWEAFEKCQPFVFSNSKLMEEQQPIDWHKGTAIIEDLDAPFPVFSIENLQGHISTFEDGNGGITFTFCVMVVELDPKEYVFFTLADFEAADKGIVFVSNTEGILVKEYLRLLNTHKMGLENVRARVQIKDGKGKRRHEIRQIIHVRSKKEVRKLLEEQEGQKKRTIDWTHRFEVRGHWVSLPGGLGKNREGIYCVNDWTWRVHHERGPKNMPLIKKVRKVETTDIFSDADKGD
jgi:hypothetical protein